jgi:hypothetical protein
VLTCRQASVKNPDWKRSFWGENYDRLSAIKSKWDPEHIFYVTPGINADNMMAKDGRLCKVVGPAMKWANDMAPPNDNSNKYIPPFEATTFPWLYAGDDKPMEKNAKAAGGARGRSGSREGTGS